MIEFKSDRIKEEFYTKIHPRLQGMMLALQNHLKLNFEALDNPQFCIVCAKRTTEENFRIYGRHKASAHCTKPCRAIDVAVNTQGHPNYLSDKAVAAIEDFVTSWFPRYDCQKAFIRHGEPGKRDHIHFSVQP